MAGFVLLVLANVAEAGDIVLVAQFLGLALVIGLALFGIDALVGRARHQGHPKKSAPDT